MCELAARSTGSRRSDVILPGEASGHAPGGAQVPPAERNCLAVEQDCTLLLAARRCALGTDALASSDKYLPAASDSVARSLTTHMPPASSLTTSEIIKSLYPGNCLSRSDIPQRAREAGAAEYLALCSKQGECMLADASVLLRAGRRWQQTSPLLPPDGCSIKG